MFHPPRSYLGTDWALFQSQEEMKLQWMPPLSQRRTSLKFALRRVTPIHWVCSTIQSWNLSSFFHTTDKLKHATRGIIETMEFWSEAITVRAMAPLEAHVAVYIVMLCRNPSNREKELQTPPQQIPPSGGTLCHLQVELGDLDNHKLHQLVEDLMQEIVQCKIHVPPQQSPSK